MSDRSTAIHEAGHAVIGRVLGLTCGGVTIIPNEQEREAGHAIITDPHRTAWDWEQRSLEQIECGVPKPKWKNPTSAFRGKLMAMMAGVEAEHVIFGWCGGGDGYDRYEIATHAVSRDCEFTDDMWERYEPRMRRQTRRLIRHHRETIERVADALLIRKTLTAEDVDDLMWFDVRVRHGSMRTRGESRKA